jgi:hypothetical protein
MITATAIICIIVGLLMSLVALVIDEGNNGAYAAAATGVLLFFAGWGALFLLFLRWIVGWAP